MEQVAPTSAPVADGPVTVLASPGTRVDPVADAPGPHGRSTRPAAEKVRGDIQGLRAVAVLIVLLFHFWPRRLPGGYVGVDVFFVISGFLISSHLLRSPPTSPRLLATFWARRIRRLLPAASLVLLATLLASLVWLPATQIPTVARQTIASALSVENWALAASATDYLAQESAASPVQHYWSLSVEEQFYVLWPLLIAVLWFLGRGRRPLLWCGVGLVAVTSSSLVTSLVMTGSDPAAAYFVTPTRVWELGLGALLAFAARSGWVLRQPVLRAVLGWVGLAMIAYAAVRFSSSTPFPGSAALVPTLGAVLVIAARSDGLAWSPGRLLGYRPSQRLGNISYSVYLWHWPVVVIAPVALDRELDWVDKLVAIAAVIVVAALTKSFVEDPARRARVLVRSLPRTFALGLTSVLVLGGLSTVVLRQAEATRTSQEQALARSLASGAPCLGADALRNSACTSVAGDRLLSTAAVARDDRPVLYQDDCWSNRPFTDHKVCTYGNPSGAVRVALLGNSHAGHWQPALDAIADERGFRLDTYLVSQCYTVTIPIAFSPKRVSDNCTAWNRWALGEVVKGDYDLLVMSNRTYQQLVGVPRARKSDVAERAYAETLKGLTDTGQRVLVLRDVPSAIHAAPDCVDAHLDDVEACSNDATRAIEPDPLHEAARADRSGLVSTLDLTDRFCRQGRCHVVIGGLIAYFDHGHMTTAFARTLVPDLGAAVDRALAGSRSG